MRYWTWLLIQDTPNKALCDVINDWVGSSCVSFDERLSVSLSARNGIASLRTDNLNELNDLLYNAKDNEILAFSLAPVDELRCLHKRFFYSQRSRLIEVDWHGAVADPSDPYHRRLVTLKYRGGYTPSSLDNNEQPTEVKEVSLDPDRRLILRPEHIRFEEDQAALLCLNNCKPLQAYNAVFLAPVRVEADSASYFAEKKCQLRQEIDRLFSLRTSKPVPAALALWRFLDDPLAQDILADGGRLRLIEERNHRTAFTLDFFARKAHRATGLDWWRRTQFIRFEKLPHPQWAQTLGDILQQDLMDASAGFVRFGVSDQLVAWDTKNVGTKFDHGAPQQGMWQYFKWLKNTLKDRHFAQEYESLVLKPSHRPYSENFDHDLAERLFASHLFRCPWTAETDPAWRQTIADLVVEIVNEDRILNPVERARRWNETAEQRNVLVWTDKELSLEYPTSMNAQDVERLRLLYPLGTRFYDRVDRVLTLDTESAALDGGFHLADSG